MTVLSTSDLQALRGNITAELDHCDLPYRTRATLRRMQAILNHAEKPNYANPIEAAIQAESDLADTVEVRP